MPRWARIANSCFCSEFAAKRYSFCSIRMSMGASVLFPSVCACARLSFEFAPYGMILAILRSLRGGCDPSRGASHHNNEAGERRMRNEIELRGEELFCANTSEGGISTVRRLAPDASRFGQGCARYHHLYGSIGYLVGRSVLAPMMKAGPVAGDVPQIPHSQKTEENRHSVTCPKPRYVSADVPVVYQKWVPRAVRGKAETNRESEV